MGVKVKEKPAGSGIWWVFMNHHGKRRAKKIGKGQKGRKLALDVAAKIQAKLALREFGLPGDDTRVPCPTLKQYVRGWTDTNGEAHLGWFDKVARLTLKKSTQHGYDRLLKASLLPEFGAMGLDEITPRMISEFIARGIRTGWRTGTARNVKNCLSAILRHACTPDEWIKVNPARGIPVPRPKDELPARDPDPLTWKEQEILEKTFHKEQPRYYPLVLCALRTGLRMGELIGLQWGDVDFHNKLILVQRNVALGEMTTPKSRTSRRHVRMTSQLAQTLTGHRISLKAEALKKGWGGFPEWVFPGSDGGRLNYVNFIYRIWNPTMEKSKLRRRTPHDMRHTYATLRLSKGDPLPEVSKEMGHASTDITYKTYYKWLPKESTTDIDELDKMPTTKRNPGATSEIQSSAEVG